MVMDEDWSTSGAMVCEAEVTIPAVSLTRPEIKRKIPSLLLGAQVIQEHRDPLCCYVTALRWFVSGKGESACSLMQLW